MAAREQGPKAGWWVLPVVAAAALALDQWTKYLVASNLDVYESWAPIPALASVFTIHYVTNTGAAFGLFQNGSLVFAVVAVAVSAVIVVYYRYLPEGQWLVRLSLGLQLAGALGNLVDRVRVGHVIDYLDFHVWPVFNLADASIVCGVALLAYLLVREESREGRQLESVDGAESPG